MWLPFIIQQGRTILIDIFGMDPRQVVSSVPEDRVKS